MRKFVPFASYVAAKVLSVPLEPLGLGDVRGVFLAVAIAAAQVSAAVEAFLPLPPSEAALANFGSPNDSYPMKG